MFTDVETFLIEKMLGMGGFSIEKVLLSANVCEDLKFKKISNAILDFLCNNLESEGTLGNIPEVKYLSNTFLAMLIEDKRWKKEGDNLISSCNDVEDESAKIVGNDKENGEFALFDNWHFEIFQVFVLIDLQVIVNSLLQMSESHHYIQKETSMMFLVRKISFLQKETKL